jgi:hypothetical protein
MVLTLCAEPSPPAYKAFQFVMVPEQVEPQEETEETTSLVPVMVGPGDAQLVQLLVHPETSQILFEALVVSTVKPAWSVEYSSTQHAKLPLEEFSVPVMVVTAAPGAFR